MTKLFAGLITAAVFFACALMAFGAQAEGCKVIVTQGNPCGPNNPHTKRIPVEAYTVAQIVPCFDGTQFYIIASNGRQWHNLRNDWNWSLIHEGSKFTLEGYTDSKRVFHRVHYSPDGELQGRVKWLF